MKIVCPECGFARELQEDKIPPTAQVATCPKCRHKFKFRELPQERPIHFSDEPEETPAPPYAPAAPPPPETAPPSPYDAPVQEDEEEDDIYYPEGESGQASEAREVPTPDVDDDIYEPANDPDAIPGPPMAEGDIWNRLESMGGSQDGAGQAPRTDQDTAAQGAVPWENLQEHGFFGGLAQTVRLAMFRAPSFFANMKVGGGILRPMAFYLLLSEFYAVVQYIWDMLGQYSGQMMGQGALDQQFGGMDSLGITPALMLLIYPVIFAVMILVSTGLTHIFLTIFRASSAGFEGTFRAATYGSAPLVLAVIPVVGPFVSMLWSLVVTIIGYKNVHKTTYLRVIVSLLAPLILLFMLAVILVSGGIMTPA